ncbi:hypothetical protein [Acetobacter nitrogenifigens]|uniref:Uncharacterized protein n=1 Tax=Acetobacter nitrogenifigens DSM 23921 = NBRC 105050 TaxID=1120919 RepID=A0A511X5F3_9PROT|nr:hypothetical protein [Acetobacter nitrogenifigens]GEN58145.1 hypothetical protein ANI02nite_00290 [Acetobacter nitrogenifigens DSM 23921 = NBRC 105050]
MSRCSTAPHRGARIEISDNQYRGLTFVPNYRLPPISTGDLLYARIAFVGIFSARIVEAAVTSENLDIGPPTIATDEVRFALTAPLGSSQSGVVTISARSADGDVRTAQIYVPILSNASGITGALPSYADNSFVYGDVFFPNPSGDAPLLMV